VLREFARIGFSDTRKILDKNNNLLPPDEWPEDIARAVKSIKIKNGPKGSTVTEIALWPKTAALDSLAKNLGLFLEHNLQKNDDSRKSNDDLLAELETLREVTGRG